MCFLLLTASFIYVSKFSLRQQGKPVLLSSEGYIKVCLTSRVLEVGDSSVDIIPKINCSHWLTNQTAIIVVDMWDTHWCRSMASRVEALVEDMVSVLAAARRRGIQVIFAPAEVHNFYDSHQARIEVKEMIPIELFPFKRGSNIVYLPRGSEQPRRSKNKKPLPQP